MFLSSSVLLKISLIRILLVPMLILTYWLWHHSPFVVRRLVLLGGLSFFEYHPNHLFLYLLFLCAIVFINQTCPVFYQRCTTFSMMTHNTHILYWGYSARYHSYIQPNNQTNLTQIVRAKRLFLSKWSECTSIEFSSIWSLQSSINYSSIILNDTIRPWARGRHFTHN